jgi:hypothetical protein
MEVGGRRRRSGDQGEDDKYTRVGVAGAQHRDPAVLDGENRDQEDAALLRLSLESCSTASITSPSNRVVVRVPRPFPPRDVADGVKLGVGLGV